MRSLRFRVIAPLVVITPLLTGSVALYNLHTMELPWDRTAGSMAEFS